MANLTCIMQHLLKLSDVLLTLWASESPPGSPIPSTHRRGFRGRGAELCNCCACHHCRHDCFQASFILALNKSQNLPVFQVVKPLLSRCCAGTKVVHLDTEVHNRTRCICKGREQESSRTLPFHMKCVCHRGSCKCRPWSLLGKNPGNLTGISKIRRITVVKSWVISNSTWFSSHFPCDREYLLILRGAEVESITLMTCGVMDILAGLHGQEQDSERYLDS